MKKKLVIVNDAPGIGKTTTCRELQRLLVGGVWLDGDWCWMANPWIVTEETKRMAKDRIARCKAREYSYPDQCIGYSERYTKG